eukprot:TRINITY_DN4213_c0_g2_i1.p1 TRINITY_DN4213_c0_g2~~TRINITY_DN4213_c0_g2_i1.p1  ORF type:complete len:237 (-),score=66.57 TRINITY_DN4213_c0_g2_i1:192-902(-)
MESSEMQLALETSLPHDSNDEFGDMAADPGGVVHSTTQSRIYHHPELLDAIQHPSPHRPAVAAARQQLSQHRRDLASTEQELERLGQALLDGQRRLEQLRELVRQAELELEGSMEHEAQYQGQRIGQVEELQLAQRACWRESDARMVELILGSTSQKCTRMVACGFERETRELMSVACEIVYDHREAVDAVIEEMLELNPQCSELALRTGLQFSDDGRCKSWNLHVGDHLTCTAIS